MPDMRVQWKWALLLVLIAVGGALSLKFLSLSGALAAGVMGFFVTGMGGWKWLVPLLVFFFSSTARRGGQVLANGGVALLLLGINFCASHPMWFWGYGGALAAAMADTWATEIGLWVRGRTIHLLSGQTVAPGESGGISLAGTLGGMIGALILACCLWFVEGDVRLLGGAWMGGVAGMFTDTLLGASLQVRYRRLDGTITEVPEVGSCQVRGVRWLSNDSVNGICTLVGALVTILVIGWQ